MAFGVMAGLLSAAVAGQAAPPAQATPAPNQRTFPQDGAMWLHTIKADKTADFEMVLGKVKEALEKSDKPERKQQAAGWKVYKSTDPAAGGNALYIFIIDPVVKGADYQISNIIVEGFGNNAETNEILRKYSEAYAAGMSIANMNPLASFK
jgi:hypothetical protein